MPKICDYATQHVEAGFEEKVKNQKKHIFKILKMIFLKFLKT